MYTRIWDVPDVVPMMFFPTLTWCASSFYTPPASADRYRPRRRAVYSNSSWRQSLPDCWSFCGDPLNRRHCVSKIMLMLISQLQRAQNQRRHWRLYIEHLIHEAVWKIRPTDRPLPDFRNKRYTCIETRNKHNNTTRLTLKWIKPFEIIKIQSYITLYTP